MSTVSSVSHAHTSGSQAGGHKSSFLDAAERLALTFISDAAHGSAICSYCSRAAVAEVIPHAPDCLPGSLLAAIASDRAKVLQPTSSWDDDWPKCECGGIAVFNASGNITRTCIRCGAIVKPASRGVLVASADERADSQPGPVLVAAAGERRVVCGRAIAVFGDPDGRDIYTCDCAPNHGDAWHEDKAAGRKWGKWGREIRWRADGAQYEVLNLGRDSDFVYPEADGLPGNTFHDHLKECPQCEANPFSLCPLGHRLLTSSLGAVEASL